MPAREALHGRALDGKQVRGCRVHGRRLHLLGFSRHADGAM